MIYLENSITPIYEKSIFAAFVGNMHDIIKHLAESLQIKKQNEVLKLFVNKHSDMQNFDLSTDLDFLN